MALEEGVQPFVGPNTWSEWLNSAPISGVGWKLFTVICGATSGAWVQPWGVANVLLDCPKGVLPAED